MNFFTALKQKFFGKKEVPNLDFIKGLQMTDQEIIEHCKEKFSDFSFIASGDEEIDEIQSTVNLYKASEMGNSE